MLILLSPYYADFLPRWRSFNWVRLPHDAQGQTLVLTPKANLGALRY